MSNKVAIVTDSTAYLPEPLINQYNISITPLSLIWGEEVYRDGVDISPAEFYKRLPRSKVMPTTSQVTPGVMHDTFQFLIEQGYDVLGVFLPGSPARSSRPSRRGKWSKARERRSPWSIRCGPPWRWAGRS